MVSACGLGGWFLGGLLVFWKSVVKDVFSFFFFLFSFPGRYDVSFVEGRRRLKRASHCLARQAQSLIRLKLAGTDVEPKVSE